ncbi:MAG: hypothetical protein EBS29_10280, partial [Chloroflexia bacterium]|nr:hypothetical protein [Chloroflexia bacterium]
MGDLLLQYTSGHDAQIVDAVQRKLYDRQQQAEMAITQIIKDNQLLPAKPAPDVALSKTVVHNDGQPRPDTIAPSAEPVTVAFDASWHDRDDESNDESNEVESLEVATASDVSFDDPVRMYLHEIGKVKLLRAVDEVVLAHRIDVGLCAKDVRKKIKTTLLKIDDVRDLVMMTVQSIAWAAHLCQAQLPSMYANQLATAWVHVQHSLPEIASTGQFIVPSQTPVLNWVVTQLHHWLHDDYERCEFRSCDYDGLERPQVEQLVAQWLAAEAPLLWRIYALMRRHRMVRVFDKSDRESWRVFTGIVTAELCNEDIVRTTNSLDANDAQRASVQIAVNQCVIEITGNYVAGQLEMLSHERLLHTLYERVVSLYVEKISESNGLFRGMPLDRLVNEGDEARQALIQANLRLVV